jgi:hypothetical protein
MAISYSWNVNEVDVYPSHSSHNNVIHNVHWKLKAIDTETDSDGNPYVSSVYGTQSLDISDLSSFTDFNSVNAAQVQGWVESALGEESVQSLKDSLAANIAEQKNPVSIIKNLVS